MKTALRTVLIFLALVALNLVLLAPLFGPGFTSHMISIESSFIAEARFIARDFPHLGWNHWWYGGFPFHLFYPPLLPTLVALIGKLADIPFAQAYRILVGCAYAIGPGMLYLFLRKVTGRDFPAVVAALLYGFAPSFAYIFPEIRNDAASWGYAPWGLIVLLRYGEGPHTLGLAFTPLAALGLTMALRFPNLKHILLAALAIAMVALSNWIALFALAFVLISIFMAECLSGGIPEKIGTALRTALLAYGLVAFWYNLSFVRAGAGWGGEGGLQFGLIQNLPVVIFIGLPLLVIALLLFYGQPARRPAALLLAWFGTFALLIIPWYLWGTALVPRAQRYLPELNMAAAMTAGLLVDRVRVEMQKYPAFGRTWHANIWAVAVLLLIPLVSRNYIHAVGEITRPANETTTSQYQVAQWLAQHTHYGERVYATGTHAFWLNVFTDVAQLRGGADYAATNQWWDHVQYQINTGEQGSISTLWARALNLRYIVVSYPGAEEVYQDYLHPHKFEGLLPEVYSSRGMKIFEVPLGQPDFLLKVNRNAYDGLPKISGVLDEPALRAYLSLLEDASALAGYRWISNERMEWNGSLGENEALLVRSSYHTGWRATCNGKAISIQEDRVGYMLLAPPAGACALVLQHVPQWDQWLGWGITAITLVGLLFMSLRARRKNITGNGVKRIG